MFTMAKYELRSPKLYADFNGLFGDTLCLSHMEFCVDENGVQVPLNSNLANQSDWDGLLHASLSNTL